LRAAVMNGLKGHDLVFHHLCELAAAVLGGADALQLGREKLRTLPRRSMT
jgi:hypothetical protein